MSDELQNKINGLITENENLHKQAISHGQGVEALMAQLDSHKAMLNEALTASLHHKAQCLLFEKHIKRLNEAAVETQKVIDDLKSKLAEAQEKIKSYEE